MPSTSFSPTSLEWIGYYDPKLSSTMSTAHWAPEPGTNNMLNYHIKVKLASPRSHKEADKQKRTKQFKFRQHCHHVMIHEMYKDWLRVFLAFGRPSTCTDILRAASIFLRCVLA